MRLRRSCRGPPCSPIAPPKTFKYRAISFGETGPDLPLYTALGQPLFWKSGLDDSENPHEAGLTGEIVLPGAFELGELYRALVTGIAGPNPAV